MKTKTCPECGDKMPATAGEICRDCMQSAISQLATPNTNVVMAFPPNAMQQNATWPTKATLRFAITPADPIELADFYGPVAAEYFGINMNFQDTIVTLAWGRN